MILDLRIDKTNFTLEHLMDAFDKIILGNVTTSTDSDGNVYPTNISGLLSSGATSRIYGSYPVSSVWSQTGTYWVTNTPSDSGSEIYARYKKVHNAYSDQYGTVEFQFNDSVSGNDGLHGAVVRNYDVDGNPANTPGAAKSISLSDGTNDFKVGEMSRLMIVITNSHFAIENLSTPNGNGVAGRLHICDFGLGPYTNLTNAATRSVMIGGSGTSDIDTNYGICCVPYLSSSDGSEVFGSINVNLSDLDLVNNSFFIDSSTGNYTFIESAVYGEALQGIFYIYGLKRIATEPAKIAGGVLTTESGGYDLISNSNSHSNTFVLQGD